MPVATRPAPAPGSPGSPAPRPSKRARTKNNNNGGGGAPQRTVTLPAEEAAAVDARVAAEMQLPVELPQTYAYELDYRDKLVLAPMVRSGSLPMRLLSLYYGAGLVWGPEIVDKAIIGAERTVDRGSWRGGARMC